jgi:hypothetical protein
MEEWFLLTMGLSTGVLGLIRPEYRDFEGETGSGVLHPL